MAKNLSALKRDKISLRNNVRNKNYKSTIKTLLKNVTLEIEKADLIDDKKISLSIAQIYSKIDKAVKRGILSKNSAARKKSLLSNKFKSKNN